MSFNGPMYVGRESRNVVDGSRMARRRGNDGEMRDKGSDMYSEVTSGSMLHKTQDLTIGIAASL